MNYLNRRLVLIKPVLLAGILGIGLLPAIGHATSEIGNGFNTTCQATVFNGDNCSLCHSGSPSANNANIPACPAAPAPTPDPVATPTPVPTPVPPVSCTDADGDGFNKEGGPCGQMDCADDDAKIHPGAREVCTDRIDNNCNDMIDARDPNVRGCPDACTDNDGDDYAVEGGPCGPVDCDDTYRDLNPGERERCDDGFDNNCDANADAVDAACQARNDDDDELEDRQKEAKRKRDRDEDHHDKDDGDGKRDSRRKGRGSSDRD